MLIIAVLELVLLVLMLDCDVLCSFGLLSSLLSLNRHTYEELAVVGIVAFFLFVIETVTGGIDPTQRHTFEVSGGRSSRVWMETSGQHKLSRPGA